MQMPHDRIEIIPAGERATRLVARCRATHEHTPHGVQYSAVRQRRRDARGSIIPSARAARPRHGARHGCPKRHGYPTPHGGGMGGAAHRKGRSPRQSSTPCRGTSQSSHSPDARCPTCKQQQVVGLYSTPFRASRCMAYIHCILHGACRTYDGEGERC